MPDWSYNGVRIFVQDMSTKDEQLIARLNPLAGDTIYHIFGWDELIINVNAYVVGLTDISALRGYVRDGTSYLLASPLAANSGIPYFLKTINTKLVSARCQTLRPDLDEDAPVYLTDLELWYDNS